MWEIEIVGNNRNLTDKSSNNSNLEEKNPLNKSKASFVNLCLWHTSDCYKLLVLEV